MMILGAVIILLVGYVLARPTLENLLGMELPAIVDLEQNAPDDAKPDSDDKSEKTIPKSDGSKKNASGGFRTTKLSNGRIQTPEGLIYNQNRLRHVMLHAKDIPDRDQRHGVFDANFENDVLSVIDQAYAKVLAKSRDVKTKNEDGRFVYTVNMKRKIGYEGGTVGKRNGHQDCRHIQLVLEKQNVITAYPIRR